jgi:hypothetical protein
VYRVILALLCGIGFAALSALLINVPSFATVFLASLLLTPGGILASLVFRSQGLGSPVVLLALNAIIYSVIAFVAFRFWVRFDLSKVRRVTVAIAIPVLIVAIVACIPSVSPLWPRGMTQLADEERILRSGLPLGSTLEAGRAFLRASSVDSHEYEISAEEPVFQNAHAKIMARPGDRLISAQIESEAEQFPCSYKIQVVLVFGPDERLREEYIERTPLCP